MMDILVGRDQQQGVIGINLNDDHLAMAETDGLGNCLNAWRVPLVTYGKNTHRTETLIGDVLPPTVWELRHVRSTRPTVPSWAG